MNKDEFEITPESGYNNGSINVKANSNIESSKSSKVIVVRLLMVLDFIWSKLWKKQLFLISLIL